MKKPFLGDPERRVSPVATEPLARDFGEAIGGAPGRFARIGRQPLWTPFRVLVLVASVFYALAYLGKANCIQGKVDGEQVILDWSGKRQYTSACYNDIVPLFGGRGLDEPGFIYAYSWQEGDLTRYIEYPVLTSLFQWLMGGLARLIHPLVELLPFAIPQVATYFTLTALVMGCCWMLVIRMVSEMCGNRTWDTLLVCASPLVITHGLSNWEILSIVCATWALWEMSKNRPALAGLAVGLGTAFKLWPLFLLGAFLVLAVRSRHFKPFLISLGTALGSLVAVNLPVALAFPDAWREFLRLNSERGWEWTTIYAVLGREFGWRGFDGGAQPPTILNAFTFFAFLALCGAIFLLGIKAPQAPRMAELVYLIIAAFLLVNKVWSPQYSLWLVVPAALALPNWRLLFSWMLVDSLTWPVLMWHMMGTENKGLPGEFLDIFVLGRDGLIIAIAVLIIAQILGRREDPVRVAHGGEDPLAGPLRTEQKTPLAADMDNSPACDTIAT